MAANHLPPAMFRRSMRLSRFITWICTAFFAGIAAIYGAILLHSLVNGRVAQFSKVPTGKSYTWADSPVLMVLSTFGHAVLLALFVMLAVWTWRTLPTGLSRIHDGWAAMTQLQRAMLCNMALTSIATLAAMALGLPSGTMRRPTIGVIWLLWLSVCVQFPLWAIWLGEIRNDVERVVRRSDDPAGFWFRWITVTAWFAFTLCLATFVCWVVW
ncbi:hypothetical protein [Roseateles sp.]|uniref:hypothetical protein n=1 Tax=Roseateles sp. TaxID=1971397 RepID=UPI00326440CE